jgi:uncharacterized protein (TIGR00266 family)
MAKFEPLNDQTPLGQAGLVIMDPTQQYVPGASWQLSGDASQILEIMVQPNQVVSTEPGTMIHMSNAFIADIHTAGGCGQACKRCCCANDSFFQVAYTNSAPSPQLIGLTPNFPGKVIAIDMKEWGGSIYLKNRAFMASIDASMRYNLEFKGFLACCCGGQGWFLNRIDGDGMVFLNSSGAIIMRDLAAGEELVADQTSVVAFQSTCDFSVSVFGNCVMCCCGGEGFFNASITGPGRVILQSMPLEKMGAALRARAPQQQ